MTSTPWDQPDSDPMGDMQKWLRQYAQPTPWPKRIKVTEAFYQRITHEVPHTTYRDPFGWVYGVPVVVDDTIPAVPGYEVEWSE